MPTRYLPGSQPLPPYRGIFIVDAKDFTKNPGVTHAGLAEEIPELIAAAFERAGQAAIWDEHRFLGHTGDGVAIAFDSRHLPYLLDPVLLGSHPASSE